ncbi:MAG: DNA primase [Planctomycetales bacterium]|nr:DNA primase [Planctomycetales bacterium]MBN8626062.1 DNA primase [Planctomycetota bacterium]
MALDWGDAKERVRQAIDIVELVGDYLQLRREGRGYKAICPWHDDSRPSLQVNPERQSFKCWVCDIGGDIFSFIMKMEGVEFPEALQLLADKAGIQLEKQRRPEGAPSAADEKRDMLQALAWAEQRFHAYLLSPEGKPAMDYLTDRGLTIETISKFHCGYSPNSWDWLVQQARQTQFPQKMLAAVGLIAERNQGPGYYDRFRGRVLFSIRDPQGRPLGFGGRVLPGISDDSPAKYVNSPETPLFQKSSLLYGLDVAKEAIQKTGTALVMEGYTDVAIAHQFGFRNAVAVLGTALGERHVKLLKRFADRVVLMLDGDEAGQRRTDEVLQLFVAENVDLRVLTLPDDLDPADFLLERGAEPFAALMERCPDALEHKYRTLAARCGGTPTLHQTTEIAEAVLDVLAKGEAGIRNFSTELSIRANAAVARLHTLTRIPEDKLRKSLAERRRKAAEGSPRDSQPAKVESRRPADQDDAPDGARFMQAETWLMEILVNEPEMLPEILAVMTSDHLRRGVHRAVFAAACRIHEEGGLPNFDALMLEFDDPQLKHVLISLDEQRREKNRAATVEEVRQLLTVLQERTPISHPASEPLDAADDPNSNSLQRNAEFARLQQLLKRGRDRQGISVPTEG